ERKLVAQRPQDRALPDEAEAVSLTERRNMPGRVRSHRRHRRRPPDVKQDHVVLEGQRIPRTDPPPLRLLAVDEHPAAPEARDQQLSALRLDEQLAPRNPLVDEG